MIALAEPAHAVRVGHTSQLTAPVSSPYAICLDPDHVDCGWHSRTDHPRTDGVAHASTEGHVVLVAEGRTATKVEVTS